jgi:hypothetical protein
VGFGVVFAWTRSLIPAIIAHVVFDIPMTPLLQGLLVAALILGALFSWRRGLAMVRQVFSRKEGAASWALIAMGTGCAITGARVRGIEYVGIGMVVLAVSLELIEARSRPVSSRQ